MNPTISGLGMRTLEIGRTPLVGKIDKVCFEQSKNCTSVTRPTCIFGILSLNLKCVKVCAARFSNHSRTDLVFSSSTLTLFHYKVVLSEPFHLHIKFCIIFLLYI